MGKKEEIARLNALSIERHGRPMRDWEIQCAKDIGERAVGLYERQYGGVRGAREKIAEEDAPQINKQLRRAVIAAKGTELWEAKCLEHVAFLRDNHRHLLRLNTIIPTYRELVIAYEKQGRLQEALELAVEAENLQVYDPGDKDPSGRIERIEKKLEKLTQPLQ